MNFQVGDKVRAFGLDGVVKSTDGFSCCTIMVNFQFAGVRSFFSDGRYMEWMKEPSLVLVERAKKKVKKTLVIPNVTPRFVNAPYHIIEVQVSSDLRNTTGTLTFEYEVEE